MANESCPRNSEISLRANIAGGAICGVVLGLFAAYLIEKASETRLLPERTLNALPAAAAILGALVGLIHFLLQSRKRRRGRADNPSMGLTQPAPPPLQFSLRGLLLFTALVGLGLWAAMPAHRYYQRQQAIARLVATGGQVTFAGEDEPPTWFERLLGGDFQRRRYGAVSAITLGELASQRELALLPHFPETTCLDCGQCKISDAEIVYLLGLAELESIDLDHSRVTDGSLAELSRLPRLRSLSLRGTPISDVGLSHLARWPDLESLDLSCTAVTAKGLAHLAALSQLRSLSLAGTKITDAALAHVAKLSQLEFLSLGNTRITDAGLEHLSRLPQLRDLDLDRTAISDAGLAKLAKMPTVRRVHLNGAKISGPGLARFAKMSQAEVLVPTP